MRLVLLLFTAGRASADGFHAGDAWRGTMTNCQQSPHMLRRAVRYVAIELSVLAVNGRKVEVQFQNHAQKDMSYKLHGEYDPSQRRLHLSAAQTTGNFGKGWSSCDALAHLSADFSTLSGVALCPSRSITAYRRAPRRRPRTRGPTPSPCWAYAVSCSWPSSLRCRRQCACHRGAPTPSRSSSRRRGSPGSRTEVVFRFSCGAYLREGKDSGSQWAEES